MCIKPPSNLAKRVNSQKRGEGEGRGKREEGREEREERRSWKLEAGSWKLEDRRQKTEGQKTEDRRQKDRKEKTERESFGLTLNPRVPAVADLQPSHLVPKDLTVNQPAPTRSTAAGFLISVAPSAALMAASMRAEVRRADTSQRTSLRR